MHSSSLTLRVGCCGASGTHTHKHTRKHTHTRTQTHTQTHAMHIHARKYTHAHVQTHICTHMHTYVCTHVHTHANVHRYAEEYGWEVPGATGTLDRVTSVNRTNQNAAGQPGRPSEVICELPVAEAVIRQERCTHLNPQTTHASTNIQTRTHTREHARTHKST